MNSNNDVVCDIFNHQLRKLDKSPRKKDFVRETITLGESSDIIIML